MSLKYDFPQTPAYSFDLLEYITQNKSRLNFTYEYSFELKLNTAKNFHGLGFSKYK